MSNYLQTDIKPPPLPTVTETDNINSRLTHNNLQNKLYYTLNNAKHNTINNTNVFTVALVYVSGVQEPRGFTFSSQSTG